MSFGAWLACYLCVQALAFVFGWGTWLIIGPGPLYGWVWGLSTLAVSIPCFGMAWEALWDRKNKFRVLALAFLISGAPARFTYLHLAHSPHWPDWLILAEAVILLWCGIVVIGMAPYRYTRVSFVLGAYWLIRGGWNLCYELNLQHWIPLNSWVPAALNLVSMATILLLLRPERHRDSMAGHSPHGLP